MKQGDTKVSIGGLYRCCIKTLEDIPSEQEVNDKDIIKCKYCKEGTMILDRYLWRWYNNENSEL